MHSQWGHYQSNTMTDDMWFICYCITIVAKWKCKVDTKCKKTYSGFAWQNAEGRPSGMHYMWSKKKNAKNMNAKSDIDLWACDWKLEELCGWVCRGEDRHWRKQAVFLAPLHIQRQAVAMTPTPPEHAQSRSHTIAHTLAHIHTHTEEL